LKRIFALVSLCIFQTFAASLDEHGYLRGMYLSDKEATASAVGGSLGISPSFGNIKTQVDFYTVAPLGTGEDAAARLFSHDKSGYSLLGGAAIGYQKDGFSFLAGRQKVVTPLIDMDDGRIIPNLFEGLSIKYDIDENLKLEGYYLTRMSGFWSQIYSGEDMSHYISMSKAAGYGEIVSNAAVWSIGTTYKNKDSKLTGWIYHSPNLIDLLYAEYQKSFAVSKLSTLEISIQGTKQNANGTLKSYLDKNDKTLKQDYAAMKIAFTKDRLSIYAAAAKVSDAKGRLDKNMMNVWAGIPQYTVLNEHVMKSFDTDGAKIYKGFIGYKFTSQNEATLSHLYVDTLKNKGSKDTSVTELVVSTKRKNFSLNAVLLFRNDNNENKNSILKSTAEYRF